MSPRSRANGFALLLLFMIIVITGRAQEPILVLPTGHTSIIGNVYYSPDGSLIASVSWDNTAKIWSARGRLLFDLKGHSGTVTAGAFSPDGNRFYTCAMDSTVCAWDLQTGNLLYRKVFSQDWFTGLALSPDGKTLLVGGWDGSLSWLEALTGKTIRVLPLHASVLQVGFSPDGRRQVAVLKDSSVRLFSSSGSPEKIFRYRNAFPSLAIFQPGAGQLLTGWMGHGPVLHSLLSGKSPSLGKQSVSAAAWSSDGRFLCTGDDSGRIFSWRFPFTEKGRLVGAVRTKITAIAFIPGFAQFYFAGQNGIAFLGNADSGRIEKSWPAHRDWINHLAVSPRTAEVVTASSDETMALWRYNENEVRRLSGHSAPVTALALDNAAEHYITISADSFIRTWTTGTGKLVNSEGSPGKGMNAVHISRQGQLLVSGLDSTAWLKDSISGGVWRPLRGATDWIQVSGFSADGHLAATGSWDGSICVYSCPLGKTLFRTAPVKSVPGAIAFSPGDSLLAVGFWNGQIGLYHLPDGRKLTTFEGHSGKVRSLVFDRPGRKLLSAAWDSTVRIWDLPHLAPLQTFKEQDAVNQALFLPGDSLILLASMDKTVKCLDWRLASPRYRCTEPAMPVIGLEYDSLTNRFTGLTEENRCYVWNAGDGSPAGQYQLGSGRERSMAVAGGMVAIATDDNRVSIFNKGQDTALYSCYAVDSAEYLITATNNRYDGTPGARRLVYYRCGREIVDLEQLKNLNWEPGLAVKRVSGSVMSYTSPGGLSPICDYTPVVTTPEPARNEYRFHILARTGGVAGFRVKLNGKPVYGREMALANGQSVDVSIPADSLRTYFSGTGPNEITAEAFTAGGVLSARGDAAYAPPLRRTVHAPDVYLISVGVSNYKDPLLHLAYPSIDAERFSMAVSGAARKLFNTDNREHVHPYLINESAQAYRAVSKRAVQELLDSLARVTTPDDIVVFFFAGHGVQQDGDRNFYLLTPEASTFSIRGVESEVAVSTGELMDWSRKMRAGKQILILDACNSGKAVGNLQDMIRSRDIPEDQARALENLRDKTGLYILSASSASQAALELADYGDGFLTYALLAGLRQGTGLRDNKFVDLNRWFNDAADRVRAMARRLGRWQEPQLIGGASFDLGMMDSSLAARIPLAAEKNIIGRSQFIQDEDLLTDELDISGAADRYLNTLSAAEKSPGFVFIPDSRRPGTYSIRGRYKITGNRLSINAFLLKNGREKMAVQQSEGNLTDQALMLQKCVDALVRAVP